MTIEEAIVSLLIQLKVKSRLGKTTEHDTIKLGIEVLERELEFRKGCYLPKLRYLPSETKED